MPSIPSVSRAFADRYKDSLGFSRRGYYRRRNGYQRWRAGLSLLFPLAVAGALLACYFSPGDRITDPRSHGTVAHVHSAIHNDCGKCHQTLENGLLDIHARWTTFDCTSCHAGTKIAAGEKVEITKVYAPHAASLFRQDFKSGRMTGEKCGDCHHDHKGESFALAKVPDAACTNCHRDLSPYEEMIGSVAREAGREARDPKKSSMPDYAGHPKDYKSLSKAAASGEQRTLKFNHAYHMTKGIVRIEGQTKVNRGSDGLPYQLQCASCHQLDSAGAYYRPVKFDDHCSKCHAEQLKGSIAVDGSSDNPLAVPHGIYFEPQGNPSKRGKLKDVLSALIMDRLVEAELKAKPEPDAGLGTRLDARFRSELAQKLEPKRDALKQKSTAELLGDFRCGYCHAVDRGDVREPNSPPIWLAAAKFSHFPHQGPKYEREGRACAACHPDQQAKFIGDSREEKGPIGIPNFESCLACHQPKSAGAPDSGTRHDCATCHKYHQHDLGRPATPTPPPSGK